MQVFTLMYNLMVIKCFHKIVSFGFQLHDYLDIHLMINFLSHVNSMRDSMFNCLTYYENTHSGHEELFNSVVM